LHPSKQHFHFNTLTVFSYGITTFVITEKEAYQSSLNQKKKSPGKMRRA